LKDPDHKGYLQKYTGNDGLNMVNTARLPSEMQTSPCYWDIIIPTDIKIH